MPAHSRLRFVADQFRLDTSPTGVGGLVFQLGTVQGVSSLILLAARIGDLTVDTLQLAEGSVTVPDYTELGANFDTPSTNAFHTFIEQNITTTGVAGQPIYVMFVQKGSISCTVGGGNVLIRALLNNSEVLTQKQMASFGAPGGPVEYQRLSMGSVTATGSSQVLNMKWQVQISSGISATARILAGARVLSVAMKR